LVIEYGDALSAVEKTLDISPSTKLELSLVLITTAIMHQVELSIALITRNRPNLLKRALKSLRAQSVQPFEVIVSDDSDSKDSPLVKRLATEYACAYFQGPQRGLYANRNFVANRCCGTHIRTMDDDHVLPAGHLGSCMEAIASDPGSLWTTGELGFLNGRPAGVAKRAFQLGPSGFGQEVQDPDNNWAIADGSTIYPRTIFTSGFHMVEQFGFGASYLEFGAFLYHHGWKSRCIPDTLVEHRAVSLSQPELSSHRFASICFNGYFRPDKYRLVRYVVPDWRRWTQLPKLFKMARLRWSPLKVAQFRDDF
jgi:glycosyltransferase involved in cell wall biosynthesis